MALISGRYASLKYSTELAGAAAAPGATVNYIGSWDLTISLDTMDATYFGSVWKDQDVGMQSWTASVAGYIDVTTESSHHNKLIDDSIEGRLVQDIRLHEGPTATGAYWIPNAHSTYGGADYSTDYGAYITNYRVTASKDGIHTVAFDLVGNGGLIYLTGGSSYVVIAE